jgi:peptide/nickel transport system permease protein
MMILLFSLYLGWLPSSEYYSPLDDFGKSIKHLILPAIAIGFRQAAYTTRLTRSSMLDEVSREYVDTARSLGLPERKVIYKYTLRNALIPTLTISGIQLYQLLGGTVVIETIFAWPGIGRAIFEAIVARDFPLIQAGVLVLGTFAVTINLLVDLMYRVLNPRVRLG